MTAKSVSPRRPPSFTCMLCTEECSQMAAVPTAESPSGCPPRDAEPDAGATGMPSHALLTPIRHTEATAGMLMPTRQFHPVALAGKSAQASIGSVAAGRSGRPPGGDVDLKTIAGWALSFPGVVCDRTADCRSSHRAQRPYLLTTAATGLPASSHRSRPGAAMRLVPNADQVPASVNRYLLPHGARSSPSTSTRPC